MRLFRIKLRHQVGGSLKQRHLSYSDGRTTSSSKELSRATMMKA
nr:unnamed protein product [Callosobruchus analis]